MPLFVFYILDFQLPAILASCQLSTMVCLLLGDFSILAASGKGQGILVFKGGALQKGDKEDDGDDDVKVQMHWGWG